MIEGQFKWCSSGLEFTWRPPLHGTFLSHSEADRCHQIFTNHCFHRIYVTWRLGALWVRLLSGGSFRSDHFHQIVTRIFRQILDMSTKYVFKTFWCSFHCWLDFDKMNFGQLKFVNKSWWEARFGKILILHVKLGLSGLVYFCLAPPTVVGASRNWRGKPIGDCWHFQSVPASRWWCWRCSCPRCPPCREGGRRRRRRLQSHGRKQRSR